MKSRQNGKSFGVRAGFRPVGSSAFPIFVLRLSFFPPVRWMGEMHDIKWPILTGTSKQIVAITSQTLSIGSPILGLDRSSAITAVTPNHGNRPSRRCSSHSPHCFIISPVSGLRETRFSPETSYRCATRLRVFSRYG